MSREYTVTKALIRDNPPYPAFHIESKNDDDKGDYGLYLVGGRFYVRVLSVEIVKFAGDVARDQLAKYESKSGDIVRDEEVSKLVKHIKGDIDMGRIEIGKSITAIFAVNGQQK
jgi:hypothetical protein